MNLHEIMDMDAKMTAIASIVSRIEALASRYDMRIVRDDTSRISVSRYISLERADGRFWDLSKKARSLFVQTTKISFQSMCALNIRISDHAGYGDGTNVHLNIPLTHADATLQRLEAGLRILAEYQKDE